MGYPNGSGNDPQEDQGVGAGVGGFLISRACAGGRVYKERADQMAKGKWQISNGFPFAICLLLFEF